MINQGVARAFARVRRPGVLTFAAVSEVGVSGRRVDGGHSLNSYVIKGQCRACGSGKDPVPRGLSVSCFQIVSRPQKATKLTKRLTSHETLYRLR